MVYPGEDEVSVELDPGDIPCLINEDSTSCTATIERDAVYQVTITQTNGVGATVDNLTLDCKFCMYIIMYVCGSGIDVHTYIVSVMGKIANIIVHVMNMWFLVE